MPARERTSSLENPSFSWVCLSEIKRGFPSSYGTGGNQSVGGHLCRTPSFNAEGKPVIYPLHTVGKPWLKDTPIETPWRNPMKTQRHTPLELE
jgi:hypothetical protein